MDYHYFASRRLDFAKYLYDSTAPTFQEIMRKVEVGEPPYVDDGYYDENNVPDEPAFLDDWQDAEQALTIVGVTCRELVQGTLLAFCEATVKDIGGTDLLGYLNEMKQGNAYGNYRALFQELNIDLASSGVDLGFIEQIILTRNDFIHNIDLTQQVTFQTDKHAKKHPDSPFCDPVWRKLAFRNPRLIVPKEKVYEAIDAVRTLCDFIQKARDTRRRR